MSALVLHKVSTAMGTGTCMEPDCSNKGPQKAVTTGCPDLRSST